MDEVGARNKMLPLLAATLICLVSFCPRACSLATPALHNASETDRHALLCLRSHLSDPAGALDSWRNESFAFCDWRGVTCSTVHAARVVSLHLDSLNITGQIFPCIGDLLFLHEIHMADNQINGHIPPEISRLTQLRYLNLSMNSITGVIPNSISSCSRLEVIHMWNNSIEGAIPPALSQCSSLREIVLSNNNLNGSIPHGIGLLPNLTYLFLPNNKLKGPIPESLGGSPLLNVVLSNNSLTGGIPPLLANCSSLNYLDLMRNSFDGEIPLGLFSNPSLATLDLSYNQFSGPIPSSSLIASQLQYVSLTGNILSGKIPDTLGNISNLYSLTLAQNKLQGSIPESLAKIPSLEALDLSYNNLSGAVPPALYTVTSLTYLGLGNNQLSGGIPRDIAYTLPNIETLVMEGNHFDGPLPPSLVNLSRLRTLELRDNAFTGLVPSFWSLPNLIELDLGANQLEAVDWSTLSSVPGSVQLQAILLDYNKLHGILPSSIGNLPRSLQTLYLSENRFTGTIPSEIAKLTNLTVLQLDGNLLSGGIPDTLGNLENLFLLGLSRNKLSGKIPESVGNFKNLGELNLEENNLTGSIPSSLADCQNLVLLNLSYNDFHGSIPPGLMSISTLSKSLDLSYNKLNGSIPSEIGSLINLDSLNISNNQLSGDIPHAVGECLHLESLRLEVNFLRGSIPESLMSLRGITEMDLSRNNLSGEIPDFFETFDSLQLLNLSFNSLEGIVPTGGAFSNSSKVFIQGNKDLCTRSPMLQLPLCTSNPTKRKETLHIISIVVPLAAAVVVLISAVATILFKKRNELREHIDQSIKEFKKFSYNELAAATNNFSSANHVGSGSFGVVYKGILKFQAQPVAIKVFKLEHIGAPKSFFTECEVLRNTRHRNLMRVISLCSSFDQLGSEFKALVLEYMANGNLEIWLHSEVHEQRQKRPLSLVSRISIATDIAAALDYLHNRCTPPLVHCDLKPSNILLDDAMVAHVSDYGLAKFLGNHPSASLNDLTSIHGPRGSVGYIAPEYGLGYEISTAGDVYSYGIILLEMLTGKHPTDAIFNDGLNLHRLVVSALPEDIGDILETGIIPHDELEEANRNTESENHPVVRVQNCIMQLAKLGLKCSVDSPKDRPMMQDVYAEIIMIKETFSALCG
ncbi:probable LRR receptor-like serine/threonine-protein kinase At3g47570 [Triticum urartu]|uniref:Receptor kinase-like protein Xa21 n=1 Tax=Triticum urartu TaxID=4572 RepID=A0A8R7VG20_TRIUA|nr:probable LRR receptor-like serine/threonine-protein kinase At3g47570 [Triticum urartu]XP_048554407.1 probable LRR receptor-like serine/threonine-protein kinase At3g47570 [Triticum urartu]